MMTFDVQFYKVRVRRKPGAKRREDNYPKPYQARWRVGAKVHPKSFATEDLAEGWLAELRAAAGRGEKFEVESGLPQSKLRELRDVTWFAHAVEYAHARWADMAGKTRTGMVESFMAVTPVLVRDVPGRPDPDVLRAALRAWAFDPKRRLEDAPRRFREALTWLEKASLPVSALAEAQHLGAAVRACGRKLDGKPAAADYFSRRRRGFNAALQYAVMRQRLAENPLAGKDIPSDWRPPKTEEEVDPRAIGNPAKARHMLTMVSYVGRRQGPRFAAWFGCMYYAMMRPEEVVGLRRSGCLLPDQGWGKLTFSTSNPAPGKQWTDDGGVHEERGLKGRGKRASRTVPIPPALVAMLREHVERFGCGPDGRLFRSEQDNPIQPSTYWRVWQRTRELALTPEEREGPLLRRPYDLRHAGVTYRLNSGVPATQVARWAGHSVEVLQRIYAQVWTEMDDVWIDRMGDHV
ncbi:integrase [Streptomonospora nanhaiensis]|uniref:Integrase n=1 Tax=Streptomonospora nanhaiensis TaxID=1323731 RepID=A0A853BK67_9ACTN|nr:tyrosine-type recombinase/integrase [Streptomonospora nanhaiensis]NYI95898.1 integrase [Streptomonospora nanhaiensis]